MQRTFPEYARFLRIRLIALLLLATAFTALARNPFGAPRVERT